MKIKVCNLGPVKEAEIELKPLTLFIGPNNTGKTWTAYSIAAVFSIYGINPFIQSLDFENLQKTYPPLYQAMQELFEEGNTKIDLVRFAEEYGESYFNDVAEKSKTWLRNFLGTNFLSFQDLKIKIALEDTKSKFISEVKASSYSRGGGGFRPDNQTPLLRALKEANDPFFYFFTEENVLDRLPKLAIKEFFVENVFFLIHTVICRRLSIFGTERTVFTNARINWTDTLQVEGSGPGILNGFLTMIRFAKRTNLLERKEKAKNNPKIERFLQLADLLEATILNGKLDFATQELDDAKELIFRPSNNGNSVLDMSVVSSMVKELSSLLIYLRYLAQPGDWIIIDEPEMNLHPEAQVRMMEFLAMLVNSGLQVLITTHSPYLVDHLANLMKAAENGKKKKISEKFYLQKVEAFLPKEKVSIYLFENGTAKSILENRAIDWSTFSEVSDRIGHLYFDI